MHAHLRCDGITDIYVLHWVLNVINAGLRIEAIHQIAEIAQFRGHLSCLPVRVNLLMEVGTGMSYAQSNTIPVTPAVIQGNTSTYVFVTRPCVVFAMTNLKKNGYIIV